MEASAEGNPIRLGERAARCPSRTTGKSSLTTARRLFPPNDTRKRRESLVARGQRSSKPKKFERMDAAEPTLSVDVGRPEP